MSKWTIAIRLVILVVTSVAGISVSGRQSPAQEPENMRRGRILENRDIFYDQWGLIVHKDDDGKLNGGDTAQREGWYWLGVWIRNNTPGLEPWKSTRQLNFDQVLKLLEPNGDGVFYRHPKQAPYNNPYDKEWGTSRDQLVPLIAAMGVWGKKDELRRLWDVMPEDLLGKHSFNGNYRNFLGQDGPNCSDIRKRDCSPKGDCSLQVDSRPCNLTVDERACTLSVDSRSCPLSTDTRSCGHDVWGVHVNDPICEIAKGTQNGIYKADKDACELAKATQNAGYAAGKAACEAAKATQNGLYAKDKAACEAQKSLQNAIFAADKATCEIGKSGNKLACEADKAGAYEICRMSNVFSGDLIGPEYVNLFRRALGQNPMLPDIDNLLPTTIIRSGPEGEAELLLNSHLRVGSTQHDKDDVGPDLNHMVALLMAMLRYPSIISDEAARVYSRQRVSSYGSYFDSYYRQYGDDMGKAPGEVTERMKAGLAAGWQADVSVPFGVMRWYHRPGINGTGANPQLAILYQPIVDKLLH
ncbi:MAG: hypothetical protein AB7F35_02035 [Acetobacteraceae bacterium]